MLLTTKEACDYYKVSMPTLIRLAKEEKIEAIKIGRQWRFIVPRKEFKK